MYRRSLRGDVAAIWAVVSRIPHLLTQMENRMSEREDQTRVELTAAIGGALAAYDAVVVERDQYKAALETADADKAAAVAAAVDADDEGDADFNAEQVEALRRLQPAPGEPGA